METELNSDPQGFCNSQKINSKMSDHERYLNINFKMVLNKFRHLQNE